MAAAFVEAGVERAFTVPGESFLPLLDALVEARVRVIATRHEGGASFMAEATGKLTGRPALCMGTRAVGTANLAIGIHTARQDSTPMIVVSGQVARQFRGREAFQEVELAETFGGLAKWARELHHPERVHDLLREGLREMVSGRPGPVLYSVPEDLFSELAPDTGPDAGASVGALATVPEPSTEAVEAVLDLLRGARRPAILTGSGVPRAAATQELVAFAERLSLPVFAAWRRQDSFPNDHPLFLGLTGYGAAPTVKPRLLEADALLVLGCRLNEITTFDYAIPGEKTRWAHVDLEPRTAHAGLRAPDLALPVDAGAFLRAALAQAETGGNAAPQDRDELNRADRAAYEAASVIDDIPWDGPGVHPGRVITCLQRVLPPEAILTTDAGNFGSWTARGYRFRQHGTFLGPTSGAMGYSLPAGIAASLARPGTPVVSLAGDGGFAMTMQELETAVREGASPVAIVFDNRRYGTIAMYQQREGRPGIATELGPIDFVKVAEACGAGGTYVDSDEVFEPALRAALASGRPHVIHLQLDPAWVSPDHPPGIPRTDGSAQ
ncbi:MAG: hypothetical protein H0W07_05320 [Chloroflexi bacterium]|nr:hypothetical protein [Chloroflexota bacterium]